VEAVFGGPGFEVIGQAGEEAEVGLAAGLEGEGQHREEEDRGEGGEGGEALAGVAAHGGKVARAAGGRKGIGVGVHGGQGSGVQGFQGVGCGR
jgi:hypothetical protein